MARSYTLNRQIFAANAETTLPVSPQVGRPYRNTGITSSIFKNGWPFSTVVNSADFNQIMYLITALLGEVESTGLLYWANNINYQTGALVSYSPSANKTNIMVALQPSGPDFGGYKSPGTNPTYWESIFDENALSNVPIGGVVAFAGTNITPPTGYLKCNGSALSRTTYDKLFAAIGTTYGIGNGSTTFNVPDFRGMFLRGDGGNAKAIGVKQDESLPNISGTLPGAENEDYWAEVSGAFYKTDTTNRFGLSSHDNNNINVGFSASSSNSIYSGSHVTPVNYAIQWLIKY